MGPWVSIVGTRDHSKQGARDAFLLARRLAKQGVTIVSGGALGIDTAAHLGALSAGGKTIVVAPTWLPFAYPKPNHRLFRSILQRGGAYLCAAEKHVQPLPYTFHRRNQVMMALSHAVVLGECGLGSGARNAMKFARELNRPRFALPFRFVDARALGVYHEIAAEGAELIADEVPVLKLLEEYGPFEEPATPGAAPVPLELPDDQARVLEAVRSGMTNVDGVCQAAKVQPDEAQHALLLLTLAGHVSEDEHGLLRAVAGRGASR